MHTDLEEKKAAQRAINSRHRLANISHHFLSDLDERAPIWQYSHIVPVLLGSKSDDYIVYQLERAFKTQHLTSMVLNIEAGLKPNQPRVEKAHHQFAPANGQQHEEQPSLPQYCLVPVTSPATILALKSERLIITVHASLPGVRMAYNQLSYLASLKTKINVCVIMIGAGTEAEARRFFGFLHNSARSLLQLKIDCGGYVLRNRDIDSGLSQGMSEVTRFISGKKQKPAPRLGKSFGPAAYLT
jgi:hypothetical protein